MSDTFTERHPYCEIPRAEAVAHVEEAPWHLIPAHDKWTMRALVAQVSTEEVGAMDLGYPAPAAGNDAWIDNGPAPEPIRLTRSGKYMTGETPHGVGRLVTAGAAYKSNRLCYRWRLDQQPRTKGLIVKKFATALIATFAIAGCANTGTERVDGLESRLSELESQVEAAANAADRAASAATRASQEASAAQSAAQRAMDAANQANERVQRISDTCCARK